MVKRRARAFAVSAVVVLVLVAWQVVVQPRIPDEGNLPKQMDPTNTLGPSTSPYLPSSQTLTNATQTGGNCGSGWTDLRDSDNVRCSYREVDRSPADQVGVVILPDGTDVNGWAASGCSTDATPWDELDDGADTNDGDTTCRQGSTNGNRVGVTMQNPTWTDPADVDDYTVVGSSVVKKTASQAASVAVDVKVGASAYNNGATQTTTTSYVRYSRTMNTNPISSAEWTSTDINNLVLATRCVDCSPNNRATQTQAKIDAIYNAEYALEVRFAWSSLPLVGDRWTLIVECQRLNPGAENVLVQVGQGGNPPTNWVTAYTCTSDTDQSLSSYRLSAAELNGGAPVIRLWDNQVDTPDDTVQGTMALDVVRIDVAEYGTGYNPWQYYVDRMVNTDNGNLHLSFRDLTVKALGWNLEIMRAYNHRLADMDGLMGLGWTFSYDTRIVEEATGIAQWWDPDGSVHTFRLSGSTWIAPPGIDAKLTKSTTFTLWFKDGSKFTFNAQGRLATMVDRNGNTVTLTWTAVAPISLTRVADQSGLRLDFTSTCDVVCRIRTVTDPQISRQIRYAYDTSHRMISYTDAMGNNTWFTYDTSNRLVTWREPGDPAVIPPPAVRKLTFRFDVSDRVDQIKQASVNAATNATNYEYVSHGIAYVVSLVPGADHAANATNARSFVTTIDVDALGSPLRVKGPQCGECASLAQGPPDGKPACCAGGGCGGNGESGGITEELTLTWDSPRNLLTRKDKGNHQFTYTYDSRRNLLNTTDPLGNVTRNMWTNVDNATAFISTLNKTTNARGFTWFYEYDTKRDQKQAKDPTNNVSKMFYDVKGYVTKMTDWRGFNTTFDYNSHGYLLNRTDATGNKTIFVNDGVGRVTKMTMPDGHAWQTQYDKVDRVTKRIDPLNNATTMTYDAIDEVLTQMDPLGRVTQNLWNTTNHQIAQVIDALGNSTMYAYDLVGNLVKITNPRGLNTSASYDNYNRRTAVTEALGNQTQITYDGDGLVTAVRNRRGYYTNYTYDGLHRLKTLTDALGNTTTLSYDQVGNLISAKNGRGFTTTESYDALNRRTRTTDALGNITKYSYDANGNRVNTTDPNGNSNTATYDGLNRKVTVRDDDGKTTTIGYDSESNLIQVRDANSKHSNYSYDALNRVKAVTEANGNTTKLDYDAVGNWLNITDANGQRTMRKFDALNRMTKSTSPLGKVTQYTYDANGNTKTQKDANGNTTTHTYDALDRLTKTAYPNGQNLTYMYDAEENRLTATGFGFTRTDVYDALNRATSTAFNYGSFSKQVQYTYDQVGNRKTMRYPEGQWANSTYDALDRLTTLSDSAVGSWTFAYDKGSRITRLAYPSGLKTEYAYNRNNWILGIYTNTSGGSVVESFLYTYDNVGNRLTMTENNGNVSTYTYDSVYRLKNEAHTGGVTINYTYDGVGNRLTDKRNAVTTTYTYDADNRLTAQGTTTFGYDNSGNQVRKTVGGQNTTYVYDNENRLTTITFSNASSESYQYSTDGNRMSRTISGAKTWYAYDFRDKSGFDDVVAEYNVTGAVAARYVQGPGADMPLAEVRNGVAYFYSFDALGSVTRITTSAQATNARYRYEAFGMPRDTSEGITNPFRFTSREMDTQTGLYYYRARWYDSQTGRFMAKDPLGIVSGPNLYIYGGNNPVTMIDPSGTSVCTNSVNFACAAVFGILAWVVCWYYIAIIWIAPWVYITCLIVTGILVGALCSIASYLICGEPIDWCNVAASAVCGGTISGSSFQFRGIKNPLIALFSAFFCIFFANGLAQNCQSGRGGRGP